jgi:hypothetical protein
MPEFAVERTLGRLGKWLRLLGFDALLETELPGRRFSDSAACGRVLLTRTRRVLAAHDARRVLFIESNDPFAQLGEVVAKAALTRADLRPYTRCLRCNVAIEAVGRAEVLRLVPDYVWQTQAGFSRCPQCRRVYWRGSHAQRSFEKIDILFKPREHRDSGDYPAEPSNPGSRQP